MIGFFVPFQASALFLTPRSVVTLTLLLSDGRHSIKKQINKSLKFTSTPVNSFNATNVVVVENSNRQYYVSNMIDYNWVLEIIHYNMLEFIYDLNMLITCQLKHLFTVKSDFRSLLQSAKHFGIQLLLLDTNLNLHDNDLLLL